MKRICFAGTVVLLLAMLCPLLSPAQGANMSNPIVMGNYSGGSHPYTDNRNNSGYGNDYGQASEDIFYQFTVQRATQIDISTCSSGFDTYLHLLNSTGGSIATNDDNGPLCTGSRASIRTTLAAGTYYIVTEGYGTGSGTISLSVNLVVQATVMIDPRNFVKTWEATAPVTDASALVGKGLREVKHSVTYFDGLGRPEQTVIKKGSLSDSGNTDIVTPFEYDNFGREVKKYMPYVASSSDGLYKATALADQLSFNQGWYSSQNETSFFGQTVYESSPLNRVDKQMAPGINWVGNNKGIETKYWLNTSADAVRVWSVSDVSNDFGTYSTTAIYGEGQLYKNVTVDEKGSQVEEFKDKEGRVILKKVQLTAAADGSGGSGHGGWLCTYYIYDDLGLLRAVLQPRAVELLEGNGWGLTTDMLNELCFRYEYDTRGRMIQKKVPGAGAVQLVYDTRDRLVMSQDANMRSKQQWLVTVYDNNFNRPVATYLITDPTYYSDAAYHRGQALSSTAYPTVSNYSNELLTETHYDGDYSGLPAGLSGSLQNVYGSYLDYNLTATDYAEPLMQASRSVGLVSWTKVKVLGDTKYLYSVNIYDEKGRVIQVQSTNVSDGIDIVTTRYDFAGKVLRNHVRHQKGGTTSQSYEVATLNIYDDLGRVTRIEKNVGGSGWKKISSMEYDALGQLKSKKLAPDYNGTGLESLTYEYNIRGWLLGTNRDYAKSTSSTANYFGFDLGYDKQSIASLGSYSAPQYNGNITGTVWKSTGDDEVRKYDFSYDAANRLTDADFNQYTGGFNRSAGLDFSVSNLSYDANGNIKTMNQKGWKVTGSTDIDILSYSYFKNGASNKLQAVSDGVTTDNKMGDFTNKNTSDDYGYDPNGNLITDLNKRIGTTTGVDLSSGGAISYNHLNLPTQIIVKDDNGNQKGTITYVYDAAGNKLKKVVAETGQPTKTTLYLFGTYEDDVLQFLPQEEGRIRYKAADGSFVYDYFLKDHLGNVRMVLTEEVKTDPYETLTFEDANKSQQNAQWENSNGQSINVDGARGGSQVNFGGTMTYAMLVRKSSANGSIGATKFLKVMAGDRIHTKVDYFFNGPSSTNGVANPVGSFVNSLISSFTNTATPVGLLKGEATTITNQLQSNTAFTSFINPTPSSSGGDEAPKAYLCVLFFDEQFHFDQTSSRVYPVDYTPGVRNTIDRTFSNAITVGKNGYAYVYFTNESDELVYFDNFNLSHERGPILEETHYYPFGLTMQGISSKAMGGIDNKFEYNGIEHNESFDLNTYDAFYRTYDPQIGRWWQIDPLAERSESWSPYAANFDNPISFSDPLGDYPPQDGNSNEVNRIKKNKDGSYTITETTTSRKTTGNSKTLLKSGSYQHPGGIKVNQYSNSVTQQVSETVSTTTIDAKGNVVNSSSATTSHNESYNYETIETQGGGRILETRDLGGVLHDGKETVTNGSIVGPFANTAKVALSGPHNVFPVYDDAQVYLNMEFGDNAISPLVKAVEGFRKGSEQEERVYKAGRVIYNTARYTGKYNESSGSHLQENRFKSNYYSTYQSYIEKASAENKGGKPKVK
ncbi:DUF6443 domain-containing protein [Chitinophagaceae bacterium LB-8]|uniref:DUF6443 domain-containing protein n=1 Tax=Paraflavisolibacter caeni TaxID=2982496 RepID=A0A9X2XUD8_9BACT|nr:DUF6443 domain-containing protein [Paraflavisolibacter caeni]MCU7549221.1 DUF6443 domain-containing protein [Paraflavisolibacter caeni]